MNILVFGFGHSGTSILKSIIGHIEEVDETIIERETPIISDKSKKFYLSKYPGTKDSFFNFSGIKIMIMRNPVYVFSSLNKRFENNTPDSVGEVNISINHYIKTLEKFSYYKKNPKKNLFTIRYEDMFENNFQNLKNIFDSIGLNYTEEIFDNSNYTNCHVWNIKTKEVTLPKNVLGDANHNIYRHWQINQDFKNRNDRTKILLLDKQKKILLNNSVVNEIYPNIKELLS